MTQPAIIAHAEAGELVPDAVLQAFRDVPVFPATANNPATLGEALTVDETRRGLAAAFAALNQLIPPAYAVRAEPDLRAVAARYAVAREAGRAADPSEGDGHLTRARWNALVRSWQDVAVLLLEVQRLKLIVDQVMTRPHDLRGALHDALCGGGEEQHAVHVTHHDVIDRVLPVVHAYAADQLTRHDMAREAATAPITAEQAADLAPGATARVVPPVAALLGALLDDEPLTSEQADLTRRGVEKGFATPFFAYRLGREDGIRETHSHLTRSVKA